MIYNGTEDDFGITNLSIISNFNFFFPKKARNNARVVFVGSLDFFSDEFFSANVVGVGSLDAVASSNEALATALSQWVRGYLPAIASYSTHIQMFS